MLKVYTVIPIKAKNILIQALNEAVGEGVYEIEDLDKSRLKSTVRLSKKNPNVILVVLDSVATDMCKDIENGLYSSDKFFSYSNDREFIEFLNAAYGLSIDVPVEEEEENKLHNSEMQSREGMFDNSDIIDEYEKRISSRDFIIKNLKVRLSDMQQKLNGVMLSTDSEDECDELRREIISLKNELLSANSVIEELKTKNLKSKSKEGSISNSEYDRVVSELTELRSSYTLQGSVITSKESKLQEFEKKVTDLEKKISDLESSSSDLSVKYTQSLADIDRLKVELSEKDRELVRYLKELTKLKGAQVSSDELKTANETIASLNEEIAEITEENKSLKSRVADLTRNSEEHDRDIDMANDELSKLDDKVQELEQRLASDSDVISQLNKDKLELQGKIEIFEKMTDGSDPEEVYDELLSTKRELSELKSGVFGKIASMSLPGSAQRIQLVLGGNTGFRLKNVKFVFAGSTGSRKGAYRCLLNELIGANSKVNFLLVDLVSETSIDYVFEISKVVSGLEWFRRGGSVQPYLSQTVLRNVSVLSPGLKYINDSYFLSVDWTKRLQELEDSGYQVFIFCGDISNLVGRIFHESFANVGMSVIYVQGNAISARSLVTNLRGISNAEKSAIGYFDYNPSVQRFVDVVKQTNKCTIINTQKR